jgi:hypothetical protein
MPLSKNTVDLPTLAILSSTTLDTLYIIRDHRFFLTSHLRLFTLPTALGTEPSLIWKQFQMHLQSVSIITIKGHQQQYLSQDGNNSKTNNNYFGEFNSASTQSNNSFKASNPTSLHHALVVKNENDQSRPSSGPSPDSQNRAAARPPIPPTLSPYSPSPIVSLHSPRLRLPSRTHTPQAHRPVITPFLCAVLDRWDPGCPRCRRSLGTLFSRSGGVSVPKRRVPPASVGCGPCFYNYRGRRR